MMFDQSFCGNAFSCVIFFSPLPAIFSADNIRRPGDALPGFGLSTRIRAPQPLA